MTDPAPTAAEGGWNPGCFGWALTVAIIAGVVAFVGAHWWIVVPVLVVAFVVGLLIYVARG